METSIKEFQTEIADILNGDEWFGQHGVDWLPEDTLNIEYEIKKNLGQTGMVAVVTTPSLDYQGEHKSTKTVKNYTETKDGNTTVWTIPDEQGRNIEVTQVKTVTPTKPYDEILEYVEFTGSAAEGEQWINTGINLSNGLRIESEWTRVVTTLTIMNFFGVRTGDANQALFGVNRGGTSIFYQKNYGVVAITAPTTDLGLSYTVDFVNGVMDVNGQTKSIDAPGSFNIPLFIGATNSNGSAMFRTESGTRFKSMKIYDSGRLVRDFVPAKKNGVACLFDKVSGQLYYNANQGGRDFIAGPTVEVAPTTVTYAYTVAGGCIPSGLDFTLVPGQTREEIVGDSRYTALLTMDGDTVPTSISISKESGGTIGKPFDKYLSHLKNTFSTDFPYDAELEYIEVSDGAYIDTMVSVVPDTQIVAEWELTGTSIQQRLFGLNDGSGKVFACYINNNRYWAVNTGTSSGGQIGSIVATGTRYTGSFNLQTGECTINGDTIQNGGTPFSSENTIPLFARKNSGTVFNTDYPATMRLYHLEIYQNSVKVRDFMPVRKDGVVYLFDTVSQTFFGNSADVGTIEAGPAVAYYARSSFIDTGVTGGSDLDVEIDIPQAPSAPGGVASLGGSRVAGTDRTVTLCYYTNENNTAAARNSPRFDYYSTASQYFMRTLQYPVTVGLINRYPTVNTVQYKTQLSPSTAFENGVSFTLFGANSNGVFTYYPNQQIYISGCRLWKNGVLVRDLVPVEKDGYGLMYDKVSGELFQNGGMGAFELGEDITPPETTDESSATFTDTVEQTNKGFDVEVSLQVVENPTVNRGKPDESKIATALDVAHRAIYTLARFETDNYNVFSPATVRQTTVAGASNKLLQVDARFKATPIL